MTKLVPLSAALFLLVFLFSGCAAKALQPEAAHVIITNLLPPQGTCTPLGDVVGSQGNWFTGDYTPNTNLMLGARNELKNQAAALGGNLVVMQVSQAHEAWGSLGTTAYTLMGTAFSCNDVSWAILRPAGSLPLSSPRND